VRNEAESSSIVCNIISHTRIVLSIVMRMEKILFSAGYVTLVQQTNICVLHILYSSPNNTGMMKSRWMRHAGSLCDMEEVINAYKF